MFCTRLLLLVALLPLRDSDEDGSECVRQSQAWFISVGQVGILELTTTRFVKPNDTLNSLPCLVIDLLVVVSPICLGSRGPLARGVTYLVLKVIIHHLPVGCDRLESLAHS